MLNSMPNSLEKAIITATIAHSGQLDKAGATYIMHPLRVACQLLDIKHTYIPPNL